MLKQDLIIKIRNETYNYQKKKNKKVIELMKDKLRGKIVRKFALLKAKIHNYLTDNNHKDKKGNAHKKMCHQTKS